MRRMILPLMLLVGLACQPPQQDVTTTGPDVEAIEAWLAQCDATFNSGDYETFLALFTDDALFMPPDSPPLSVDDVRSFYQVLFQENRPHMTTQAVEIVVSGDLAVARATYEESVTPLGEGEALSFAGPWVVVLRKQGDGPWKGWHNIWTNVPPTTPEKV